MKKDAGMKFISSCSLCHASNRRTIDILHTNLQPLYEKLKSSKIEDETPMCFICHRRLQQCHQFVTLINETASMREEYIKNGYITNKPSRPLVELSICSVMNFGIPFDAADLVVKDELDIKEEPVSDGDDSEVNEKEDSEEEPENGSDEEPEDESDEEPEDESYEEPEDESEEEEPSEASSESEDDIPLKAVKRKRNSGDIKNNVKKETQVNKKMKKSG